MTIIWIAFEIRPEHRAALDWLNEITGPDFHFFGLELQLWRIGDSPVAPKFNVVSQPNDWSKRVKLEAEAVTGVSPEMSQLYTDFWSQVQMCMQEVGAANRLPRNLSRRRRMGIRLGRSYATLMAEISVQRKKEYTVYLILGGPKAKANFHLLRERFRVQIEASTGPLEWQEYQAGQRSYVVLRRKGNPADRTEWPAAARWVAEQIVKMHAALVPLLPAMDATVDDQSGADGDGDPGPE